MTTSQRRRFAIVGVTVAIALAVLFVQYARLMVYGARVLAATRDVYVERGPILDRNGQLLAIQTQLNTVTAWVPQIQDIDGTAGTLAEILSLDAETVRNRLRVATGDVIIKRTISPAESTAIEVARAAGRLSGITLRTDFGRVYPAGEAAAAVIGFVGVDNTGLEGIEYRLNEILSPPVPPIAPEGGTVFGNQVFLTIDMNIQQHADRIVERTYREHQADSVTMLILAAKTGEVLASSSSPGYDPNRFAEYSVEQRRNRPISSVYEPGSVFKVFSMAAFMELGGIDSRMVIDTTGGYRNPRIGTPITDLADYGPITPEEVIKFSSNVGAAYASDTVTAADFLRLLTRFGFGAPTGVDMNGEERGILREVARWSERTKPSISFGQEIGVTAMQIAAGATVFANQGLLLKPRIITKIVSPHGQVISEFERLPVRQVVRPEIARTMLEYMEAATADDGTGRRSRIDGVRVATKTGTAEMVDTATNSYSTTAFLASALSLFPADDPSVIVYFVVEHPKAGEFLGGRIAAPVIQEVAEYLIPYLGIRRDGDEELALPGTVTVVVPQLPDFDATIPDLIGLPLRTILPLFGREDLDFRVSGSGFVVEQEPPAGTAFEPGQQLRVRLE